VSEAENGRRVTGAWTCADYHGYASRKIVEKESQSPGTPHWQRTWKVWVLSREYETSVLETNVAYLLIRADDLVHRHVVASEEQGRDATRACSGPDREI
jgi:hypothetical protein